MTHTFTSLRHPVEKLLEAEHFLGRMNESDGLVFQFELNAFLSASRSVTFVLQAAMAKVGGFADWYGRQRERMTTDDAMRFLLELRNVSQKEGPVALVGGSLPSGGWTYRFVGSSQPVPTELIGRDISASCAAHLIKLADLLQSCVKEFPFQTCPAKALTVEGMEALGYSWRDVEAAIGLPLGYTDVGEDFPAAEKLRILRREVEPLDTGSIERIAEGDLRRDRERLQFRATSGTDLIDDLAATIDHSKHPRDAFLATILSRIRDNDAP